MAAIIGLAIRVWHHRGPIRFDQTLLHGYAPRPASPLFRLTRVLTEIGSPVAVIILAFTFAAIVWRRQRSWVKAGVCVVAPALAGVAETAGKVIVGRTRPLTATLTGERGVGFPSGHAAGFAALALIVALSMSKPGRPRTAAVVGAVLASALVAASRVVVGAHYPTDVIAGLLLGLVIADGTWCLAPYVVVRWSHAGTRKFFGM